MEKRLLKKEMLPCVVKKLSDALPVYGPVREGDTVLFRALEKGEEPLAVYGNSRNVPKQFLFPQREEMCRYTRAGHDTIFVASADEPSDTVLFGVRPCDARSFVLLDKLFDQENYRDPYYVKRRDKTVVLAMACIHPPAATCFCTAVGGEPVSSEGADILLTDLGESYLVEFLTPRGERLLPLMGELAPADDEASARKGEIAGRSAAEILSPPPAKEIKPVLERIFGHAYWDGLHGKCLRCGTCTYLCPTCHCFDISDETMGKEGVRLRSWDSCMYPLFTLTASGHNPRPSAKERWRQRVMHKFSYFVDNFGAMACVGCGRCVMLCPVNLDIRKIIADIAAL